MAKYAVGDRVVMNDQCAPGIVGKYGTILSVNNTLPNEEYKIAIDDIQPMYPGQRSWSARYYHIAGLAPVVPKFNSVEECEQWLNQQIDPE